MFAPEASQSLIREQDIESLMQTMFGASPGADGVRMVVKIDGRAVPAGVGAGDAAADESTRAAIRELTNSLQMYSGVPVAGDVKVNAPPVRTIGRALGVLADPMARRQTLGAALTIFGRRVTAPLERILSAGEGGTAARLAAFRTRVLAAVDDLQLADETTQVLRGDLAGALRDDYLHMLVEYEEKTLRPRLEELAHKVLDVLAMVFHRALDQFGSNAERIGEHISRKLPKAMALRDVPTQLRQGFVDAVADFLAVETSAELTGALHTLSGQYADVVPGQQPLGFAEEWYRDVAFECWKVIATYS